MVECDLAKVEVAGSNPVSRSKLLAPSANFISTFFNSLRKSESRIDVSAIADCEFSSSRNLVLIR